MNNCNICNTPLLQQIDFKTNQNKEICVSCDKIDPRNKEIVNATPLFFNSPIVPDKPIIKRLDLQIPELFPPKYDTNITTIPTKWSPYIQQNIMITESTKPALYERINIKDQDKNKSKPSYKFNGKIKIDWSPVIGYDNIKHIIDATLTNQTKKKIHLLIGGAPGTSKTVFLKTIETSLNAQGLNAHYIDATTLSSSGVIQYLFDNDVKFALVDELDKLIREHQGVFLNLLESGVLQETKSKKIRKKDMRDTIFICTGNYLEKLMIPLLTRFLVLNIPKYSEEQFKQIGIELLTKQYNKNKEIADYIVKKIWSIYTDIRHEDPNLRQCVQVAALTDNNKQNIDYILDGITTYSKRYEE